MVKLRRVYEYNCFESQKDLDDLKDHLGDNLYNDYMKIRDRIPKNLNDYKDFQKLKKLPISNVKNFVDNFQSESERRKEAKKGAKKLYEDSDWLVYKITTYPAAVEYGKGTKWCITGSGVLEDGSDWFDHYIEDRNLDGGYYYFINKKDSSKKYCILQTKDKKINSIWDAKDRAFPIQLCDDLLPEIKEIPDLKRSSIDDLIYYIRHPDKTKDINIENIIKGISNLNQRDSLGNLPLNEAVQFGNEDIVKLLLQYGADPNSRDSDGRNSLFLAEGLFKRKEHRNIVNLLLEHGADPNCLDKNRNTPLMNNLFSISITESLLEHGADPNIRNFMDDTALLIARDYYTVLALLEHGADPNVKNEDGVTPLLNFRFSYSKNDKKVVDLLKEYGAKE